MKNIGYILDHFPVFSETFILREILELRKKGFDVRVMARLNTTAPEKKDKVIHRDAERLMSDVYYFSAVDAQMPRWKKALCHLRIFAANPARYLRTFGLAYGTNRETFWYFKQAVLHAVKVRGEGIEHIHAHFADEASKYAMLISMLTGIPYSFTVHAHDIFLPEFSDMMEDKFRHARFTACISQYNSRYIAERYPGVDREKLRIVHCGIDFANIPEVRARRNPVFTIVSVGRLVEHKGFRDLVEACGVLDRHGVSNFECRIIGEGEQRSELEALIAERGLEGIVRLRGAMEQLEVLNAIGAADLFVLPCVVEKTGMQDGIPVALMEAMALGVPVVSTKVSGIPELVKDGAGILVEPGDPRSLASAMEKVMRFEEEARLDMGRKGRDIVKREFNLSVEVQKLADLFQNSRQS